MSITSASARNDYTGNGATGTYSYGFRITDDDHLRVTIRDTDDAETTLTKTTHYTVTGVDEAAGGSITLVDGAFDWETSGNLKSDYHLTIRRVVPLKQETDIRNQGDYYPETHEDTFDYLTSIDQQQQDEVDRSVKLPETVAAADFDAEMPAALAGSVSCALVTNLTGDGWAVGPTVSAISGAQTSATAAAASATAAATSATAAATSATAAATSATAAATSATAAATAETNAETAETNAELAETNAETAQAAAEAAQAAASASQTAAATSATNAATSATAAATSATNASNSATAASTSATNAATSATAASGSATAAAASATAADASADAAAASAAAAEAAAASLLSIATKTANYTLTSNDDVILGDATSGAITMTLPAAGSHTGRLYYFKKIDTSENAMTIATLDGGNFVLYAQNDAAVAISDGTNWRAF
jgi:hypothetical protein